MFTVQEVFYRFDNFGLHVVKIADQHTVITKVAWCVFVECRKSSIDVEANFEQVTDLTRCAGSTDLKLLFRVEDTHRSDTRRPRW